MSKFRNYLNERSVSTAAFWISPKGEITSSLTSHIDIILKNPEKFGFTKERLEKMYKSYGEPIGLEGKAREEIVKLVIRKRFIRIRKYPNKFWSVNIFHKSFLDMNYVTDWAKKLTTTGINGLKENDMYLPVIITDLGSYRKEVLMGELAKGNLLEGKELIYMTEVKNVILWEDLKG